MRDILLKLANNENEFVIEILGQPRKCKIIKLDLWGLDKGKGRALVTFKKPIKKTIRREVDNNNWGHHGHRMEDIEVESYEEWVNIGY